MHTDPSTGPMQEDARWSLITVTYNSATALARHWAPNLPSDVEWIVVDNNSADQSAELAESLGARVIRLETNLGFGAASNVGFRSSVGSLVAFVNPDITVDFASLKAMESSLQRERGLVAPQLIYADGTPQPGARRAPSLSNKVLSRLRIKAVMDRYYVTASDGAEKYASWVIGAAVASSRSTFSDLGSGGPWNEKYFVYYEDSDLGLRAWARGLSVRVIGCAPWTHGWARETAGFKLNPWLRELASMIKFYTSYPDLLVGSGKWSRFRRRGWERWGSPVRLAQEVTS